MQAQVTREWTLTLNNSEPMDLPLLDEWLSTVWKINNEMYEEALHPMGSLIKRQLLLVRVLLQAVKLPCFDTGTLTALKQDAVTPSKWNAKVRVVYIDYIADSAYYAIINFAVKIVYWMMKNPITATHISYLFQSIQKELIHKFKGVSGSGKSTMPILRAAYEIDIPFFHLGGGTYQLGWGKNSRQISLSMSDLDSHIGAKMSNNKILTSNLIRMAGLPAPVNGVAKTIQNATVIASKIGWPVVVKPVDADRGEGVTVDISTTEQLEIAFKEALKFSKSKNIIIERQVRGVVHRIFIVNSKLLYAVKRLPISIVGDGKKQISELIQEANKLREDVLPWLRDKKYPADDEAAKIMKKARFSLTSIPKNGELVPLRTIESTADGGTPKNVTDDIHPDNIDISLRTAKLFKLDVAGIDIISPDISEPWHKNGAIINEINLAPVMGASEISRSYIPAFLKQIIKGDGRIPIHVVVGGSEAMEFSRKEQNDLITNGVACFLTSHIKTFADTMEEMILPVEGLYKRCQALLLNTQVETIIVVIQTDEFLYTGFPIDKIDQLSNIGGAIRSLKNINEKISQDRLELLLKVLKDYKHTALGDNDGIR